MKMRAIPAILLICGTAFAGTQAVDAITAATLNNATKIKTCVPTATSVTITWSTNHNVSAWTLTLTPTNGTPITRALTATEASSKSLIQTGLTSSTNYTIRIEQNAGSQMQGYTASAASTTFNTLAGSAPLALQAAANITETSATVSWTGGTGTSGSITVTASGGGAPVISRSITAGEFAALTLDLTGLTAGTNYTVTVNIGAETQFETFQTSAPPPLFLNVPSNINDTSVTISWTGGSGSTGSCTCTPIGGGAPIVCNMMPNDLAGKSMMITGLAPGTNYNIDVTVGTETQSSSFQTTLTVGILGSAKTHAEFSVAVSGSLVHMTVPSKSDVTVGLYSLNGSCIRSESLRASGGVAAGYIPVNSIAAGRYIVRIVTNSGIRSQSIIVQR